MANLDVNDVLDDPDFNSSFQVARRVRTVGDNGRSVVTETILAIDGVVQPMNNKDLERFSQGDRVSSWITVWSRVPLMTVTEERLADEILWDGSRYQVIVCDEWHYGEGYWQVQAMLVLQSGGYNNA